MYSRHIETNAGISSLFSMRSAKVVSDTLKYKNLLRLGINVITASTWKCRMTWHRTEWNFCDKNLPRALELTLADSLQGVEIIPCRERPASLVFSWCPTCCLVQVQRETCILFLPCLLSPPLFLLLILTLMVKWENWVTGIFFCQTRYWSFHPQLSPKCVVRAVLCCKMLGSHPWTALRSALMPSFQEEGAYCRHKVDCQVSTC